MSEIQYAERPDREQSSAAPMLKADPSQSATQQLHVARKVARKAVSLSAMSDMGMDSLAAGGAAVGEELAQEAGGGSRGGSPADIANQGFSGSAQEVPHRAKMEKSFGMDFGGVQAYTDGPALKATEQLGAHAYAMGSKIAFSRKDPDEATVAHELTHVLQHTGQGPARKADGGGGDGDIDVSGEGEAEAVEQAVAAGKPARSVWEGGEAGGEAGAQVAASAGPARKAKGPARLPITHGMAFSRKGFERSKTWDLWENIPKFKAPIPAVPGLFAVIAPSVQAKKSRTFEPGETAKCAVGIQGGVFMGFEFGSFAPDLLTTYGGLEASASGGFEFGVTPSTFFFAGDIKLASNFTVGMKMFAGKIDIKFDFGKVDPICTFGSLKWDNTGFHSGWFQWGDQVLQFFAAVKSAMAKAKALANAGGAAVQRAQAQARAGAQQVWSSGQAVVNWVSSW